MWWWIIGIAVAAVIVLLAPFIREPQSDSQTGNWIATVHSIVGGFFGR